MADFLPVGSRQPRRLCWHQQVEAEPRDPQEGDIKVSVHAPLLCCKSSRPPGRNYCERIKMLLQRKPALASQSRLTSVMLCRCRLAVRLPLAALLLRRTRRIWKCPEIVYTDSLTALGSISLECLSHVRDQFRRSKRSKRSTRSDECMNSVFI